MSPVAFKFHEVIFKDHKICRTCCVPPCPDPNGCEGMSHQWSIDLHGTPWDGIYTATLMNCGCPECPDLICPNGRNLGSGWNYVGEGFTVGVYWPCQPYPNGGRWWVWVDFMHEGVERSCIMRYPGGSNPCSPEGLYDEPVCSDAEESTFKCWTSWCSTFWAEVSAMGVPLASATPLQRSSSAGCKSCRGLA